MDFQRRDIQQFRTYGESYEKHLKRQRREEIVLQKILDNYEEEQKLLKHLKNKKK
jgi:hypothetical protein